MNPQKLQTRLHHLALTLYVALLCSVPPAWAAGSDPWDNTAEGILDILNGGIMRTLAVIVVIFVGVGILSGRVAMETGVRVIAGIVVIFAAGALVDLVVGWST